MHWRYHWPTAPMLNLSKRKQNKRNKNKITTPDWRFVLHTYTTMFCQKRISCHRLKIRIEQRQRNFSLDWSFSILCTKTTEKVKRLYVICVSRSMTSASKRSINLKLKFTCCSFFSLGRQVNKNKPKKRTKRKNKRCWAK